MTRSLDSGREAAGGVIKVTRGVSGQNHERKQFRMGIRSGGSWLRPTLVMFFMMSCAIGRSYALDIAYCSSDNTGSSSTPSRPSFLSKHKSEITRELIVQSLANIHVRVQ